VASLASLHYPNGGGVDFSHSVTVEPMTEISTSLPLSVRPGEGRLTEWTPVARPWPRERLFVPRTCRSRQPAGPVQMGGFRTFAAPARATRLRRFRTSRPHGVTERTPSSATHRWRSSPSDDGNIYGVRAPNKSEAGLPSPHLKMKQRVGGRTGRLLFTRLKRR